MRRPTVTTVLAAAAVLAIPIVILVAVLGPSTSKVSPAAGAHYAHGKMVYPARLASQIRRLNEALDGCYSSHGARKVPFDGGGWSYDDPHGVAARACARQQAASNAFVRSHDMAAFSVAVQPLANAYRACMNSSGALPKDDDHVISQSSPRYVAAVNRCSMTANSKAAIPPAG